MTTTTKADKEPRSLYQRIADVQAEIDDIKATGKNQYAAKALSIGDIEGALRKLLAVHGIVTRWRYATDENGVARLTVVDKLWQAQMIVHVQNADDEDDFFEDVWVDVGGNPMACTSFDRKGYLKALFHITEETDEHGNTPTPAAQAQRGASTSGAIPPRAAPVASPRPQTTGQNGKPNAHAVVHRVPLEVNGQRRACPDCGDGLQELLIFGNGDRVVACTSWRTCKWRRPVADDESVLMPAATVPVPAGASDVDPDDIPFAVQPTADERERLSGAAWAARQ